MDISNKFLAFLLVIAIVVSVVGVWYSVDRLNTFAALTGFASQDTGYVNVTVESYASLIAVNDTVNFGTGQIAATYEFARLTTEDGGTAPANWTNSTVYDPQPLRVENNGNVNLSVDLTSNATATQFIGGNGPDFEIAAADVGAGACASGLQSAYTDVTGSNQTICSNLGSGDGLDEVWVNVTIQVPTGVSQGAKSATFIFTGTAL